MSHTEVLEYFKAYFPQFAEHISIWFQNGKNSIRVRQTNNSEYIFTYNGKDEWKLETIANFMRGFKK